MVKRLVRYVIAAAVATAAVPFIAGAASGDVDFGVRTVASFPVLHGVGLKWITTGADGYRVERKVGDGDWQDASGGLGDTTSIWVDHTLTASATADYRIIANKTDGLASPSPVVTATRPAQDPTVGATDLLALDADPGGSGIELTDQVAGPVTADGNRLTAGGLVMNLPGRVLETGEFPVNPFSG